MSSLEYPIGFEIRAREVEDGLWQLDFKEFYPKGRLKETLERTREVIERLGYEVKIEENSLSYTAKEPKTVVFDMLAGEFLGMSNLGSKTLGDLFASIAIIAAESKRE